MRFIQKGMEPESLTQYKMAFNAHFDGFDYKDDIRENLLREQGYLCGYCMRRLKSVQDVKIEHVITQSALKENEREALNYRIMLGVCYGNEGKPRKMQTCDTHRGNEDLKVNPFQEESIRLIRYKSSDGTIYSNDSEIQKDLDRTLNLNYNGENSFLKLNRKAELDACIKKLSKLQNQGLWSKNILRKMLQEYETPDQNGMLRPYSGIVVDYIKRKLERV